MCLSGSLSKGCLPFSLHFFSPPAVLPIDEKVRCCLQLSGLFCDALIRLVCAGSYRENPSKRQRLRMQGLGCAWLLFVTLVRSRNLRCVDNIFSCQSGFPLCQVAVNKMLFHSTTPAGNEQLLDQPSPHTLLALWPVEGPHFHTPRGRKALCAACFSPEEIQTESLLPVSKQ